MNTVYTYLLPLFDFIKNVQLRVSGGELFARVAEIDRLPEEEAVCFISQIIQGVEHLHDLGIVHLDLKVRFKTFGFRSSVLINTVFHFVA